MTFTKKEVRFFKSLAYASNLLAGFKDSPGDNAKTAAFAWAVTHLTQSLNKKRKPSARRPQ